MERFKRLVQKAAEEGCRLLISYDPDEIGEEWSVKYYPDREESDHFYTYNSELESASYKLLDDLRGENL